MPESVISENVRIRNKEELYKIKETSGIRVYFGSFFIAQTVQTGFMEILDLKVLSERHGYARISVLKQLVHYIHIEKAGKEDL